ncbi:MAG: tandem-95 repeat protein, partial [Candidatus Cloacimonadota bacterium]|nr:tandem-95 repeat protein [Candidatus Cloacimonadota bacterium]
YIQDIDNEYGELELSYTGNENITVAIDDFLVTFSSPENWFGSEQITFMVNDETRIIDSDNVAITVLAVQDNPILVNPIEDFSFDEDTQSSGNVNLNNVFFDAEGGLLYSYYNNENLSITILSGIVTFTPDSNWFGTETITFAAFDPYTQSTVIDDVEVTVLSINDSPQINLPSAISYNEDETLIMNLSPYISDVESDDDELILTVSGNTELNIEIDGLEVTINSNNENWNGFETITFTIDDGEDSTTNRDTNSADIIVNCLPVNDPPVFYLPESLSYLEDESAIYEFDYFVYDSDDAVLDLSLISSGGININVDINWPYVTFSSNSENWNGSEEIYFTVYDEDEAYDIESVIIICEAVNDAPYLDNTIDDLIVDEDFGADIAINLNNYFDDDDNDELVYSYSLTNEIVEVEIVGSYLYASSMADVNGVTSVTITADDGFAASRRDQVEGSFQLTITPINDAPTIISYLPEDNNFEILEESNIDFSINASDIDNETLDYSWFINDENMEVDVPNFSHLFIENGEYEIKCIVSDGEFEDQNIWEITVDITANNNDSEIPIVTNLIKNYPNPFNPTTNIQFGLDKDSYVKIEIYNIKGQKIYTLVDDDLDAGFHTLIWNGVDVNNKAVASGVYFYRLRGDSISQIRSMVFLR